MKAGFTLIVIAAIAGLVGALAPIDGGSLLPALIQYLPPRGVALGAGFAVPLGIGLFALAKERMSKALAVASFAGFLAAGAAIEVWTIVQRIGANIPVTGLILTGAIVLGVIGSVVAIVKGNND